MRHRATSKMDCSLGPYPYSDCVFIDCERFRLSIHIMHWAYMYLVYIGLHDLRKVYNGHSQCAVCPGGFNLCIQGLHLVYMSF